MGEIKKAYIKELEKRLAIFAVRMNELQQSMDKSDLEHSHKLFKEMAELRLKNDETREKLQELIESNHPEWEHFKHELEAAWQFIHRGLEKMAKGLEHQWDKP